MKKILLGAAWLALSCLPAAAQDHAIAVMRATGQNGGQVLGYVWFTRVEDGVKVQVKLHGLTPNSTHGFHVHELGDVSAPDATSAGGHFSPEGHPHGSPDADKHHAGDLGNLKADANGNVDTSMTVDFLSLDGEHSVLGRALILHAKADDLKSQPSGDAGARMGAGVIGVAGDKWGVSPEKF